MNYAALAQTARQLVAQNGRTITLKQLKQTDPTPTKPWVATGISTPAATKTASAVAVPPSSATALGLSTAWADQTPMITTVYIVAPAEDGTDLSAFEFINDGGKDIRVVRWETLRPGSVTLLYFAMAGESV